MTASRASPGWGRRWTTGEDAGGLAVPANSVTAGDPAGGSRWIPRDVWMTARDAIEGQTLPHLTLDHAG
jgi:hypothetical protein